MDMMGRDNKWLILNSVEECSNLIARINADRAINNQNSITRGHPILLSDGKYAQCVDDLSDYLTEVEVNQCVSDDTFLSIISNEYKVL